MPLSQISVRVDDELKQRADIAMKHAGTNPTQAITYLYQYIAEHEKLPFSVQTRFSSPEDTTKNLIEMIRSIYDYWKAIALTSTKTKEESGATHSIAIAKHITAMHRDLITDSGNLSADEVASLMNVIECILTTPFSFYCGAEDKQETKRRLDSVCQAIQIIEQNHGMLRYRQCIDDFS